MGYESRKSGGPPEKTGELSQPLRQPVSQRTAQNIGKTALGGKKPETAKNIGKTALGGKK